MSDDILVTKETRYKVRAPVIVINNPAPNLESKSLMVRVALQPSSADGLLLGEAKVSKDITVPLTELISDERVQQAMALIEEVVTEILDAHKGEVLALLDAPAEPEE